ncbi:hypothetical protein [Halanaerobaculum tunisiense]
MKINDSIALGVYSGIVASIIQMILNVILKELGLVAYYLPQISGSVFLLEKFTDDPLGFALGPVVWLLTGGSLGIIIVYLFKITGTDHWWLKGILVSNVLMYIGIYGILFNLGGAEIVPYDITTNLHVFIQDLLFGLTTAYLIIRWGNKVLEK